MSASQRIYEKFLDGTLCKSTLGEICKKLDIPYREKPRLVPLLDELCKAGKLYQHDGGRYGTIEQLGLIKGKISGNERGFGFLVPENGEQQKDFFIPRTKMNGALHGDTVLAELVYDHPEGAQERDEVSVVAILSRGFETIVGTFRRDRRAGYLYPDEKKFSTHVYIPLEKCYKIKNGVKAVAKITSYPERRLAPGGEIIEVLGDEDDFFAEELSIIRSYDLREEFPERVEKEARKMEQQGIRQEDLQNRRDFRDEIIVTIDGEDTRDIDDAITLKKENGVYHLGVHIADVSHYVLRRSALDDEAYERGTSVYFPDCVLPMLPRALSNGICSLNEGEDRLTLSCLIDLDENGKILSSQIVEGVIRSTYKMTYTDITKMLDSDSQTLKKYPLVADMVPLFAELTRILQAKRDKKGGVTMDVKEAKILFDKDTYQITIPNYERAFSYQIIEAFMVLANETVAEYMHSIDAPFIYRVHEKPTPEKAVAFRDYAQTLGVNARFQADDVKPYDYQRILKATQDLPVYSVLNRVMLRSMQKARYEAENLGHFGLASDCYCHFTSPIRRYPDLCIHRVIKQVIGGGYADAKTLYGDFVEQAAKRSSERERRATEAERDVDDLYKTMYMSEHIGEEYDAVISGVTSFGIFAELPNTIEGIIPIESMFGEYKFDADRFTLIGKNESYRIGERLRVKVTDVDFYRRRTEFRLLEKLQKEEEQ